MNPLSGVIGEAWDLYKKHWQHFLSIALIVYVVVAIITALLAQIGWLGFILGSLVAFIGAALVYGALITAVSDIRDGRADLSVGQTFSAVTPILGTLLLTDLLWSLGLTIGFILLIIPGLFLLTIWAVVFPALVLERRGVFDSFSRSQELVRGNGWNVFGVIVLSFLIYLAFAIVLGLILSPLNSWLETLIRDIITGTLVTPFVALLGTLIYYRLTGVQRPATP